MNDAMVELLMRLERSRNDEAKAFVVVTVDCETGDVVNACGPFEQSEMALVQAAKDDVSWKGLGEPDEAGWKHVVVPLWEPTC